MLQAVPARQGTRITLSVGLNSGDQFQVRLSRLPSRTHARAAIRSFWCLDSHHEAVSKGARMRLVTTGAAAAWDSLPWDRLDTKQARAHQVHHQHRCLVSGAFAPGQHHHVLADYVSSCRYPLVLSSCSWAGTSQF